MTIALPLLLLFIGVVSFWLLVASKVSWIWKILVMTAYCLFTVVFFNSISSFLGWGATDMPEKVSIHGVVIKEPNPIQRSKGSIFLTVESFHNIYEKKALSMFGYNCEKYEPRLYRLPYSRKLHEQLEKEVIPRLKEGQVVDGLFKKKGKGESDGNGEGDGSEGKGKKGSAGKGNKNGNEGGSESQEQEYHFYNLPPSEIQRK